MRKWIPLVTLIIFFHVGCDAFSTDFSRMTVLSPTSGQQSEIGTTLNVSWVCYRCEGVALVNVYLMRPQNGDSAAEYFLIGQGKSTGQLVWLIGSEFPIMPGQYVIAVFDHKFGAYSGPIQIRSSSSN